MSITAAKFREVMRHLGTGVTIVTTKDENGQPYGLTVNSFTSVSMNPLLVLVCLDHRLSGLEAFKMCGYFGVNILAEDQEIISTHFAQTGSDRSRGNFVTGKTGVPLLDGVLARMECKISAWYPAGDHDILVGEVRHAEVVNGEKGPLLYYNGRYRRL